jgi:hypothetical protein
MTSTNAASPAAAAPHHAHHHRAAASATQADPLAAATDLPAAGTTAGTPTASPAAGIQKFASELQSILISAQAGQTSASGATASNASAAADPASATDPTPGSSPANHVASRLQALLGGSDTTASGAGNLKDVVDRLQQSLAQTLQGYASSAATPASSVTA